MLFNSIDFVLFFILVFFVYWIPAGKSLKGQNWILLLASYYFYSCWDVRFLLLLAFSTFLCYFTGLRIHSSSSKRVKKGWLWVSVLINLGFLGFFKYYNFFAESFSGFLQTIGFQTEISSLSIILPVGISFYTFHGLSYVFDIYHDRLTPTRNFVDYSLFVSFFPLLIAGPIERATHLLPQISKPRQFDYNEAVDGLKQILWGLFKKMVIADNCAQSVNLIFNHSASYSGSTLVVGAVLFAIQIYGDFSGYTDIALGTARLLGFELLRNFAFPYFSRDIAEFWRRWHISLSSWFRDYLYIPLGGSHGGMWTKIRNTFIIFVVSGFWHGANWTFIVWGALNALFMMPLVVSKRNRNHLEIVAKGRALPSLRELGEMALTFALAVIAWIFFRAQDMSHAFTYLSGICSISLFSCPQVWPTLTILFILFFFLIEWRGREQKYALAAIGTGWINWFRWGMYYAIFIVVVLFKGYGQHFIYFQF
jgi:D-alanyl-lipoteichoic acid acyltransferase DltB (MBOAT superfamily)